MPLARVALIRCLRALAFEAPLKLRWHGGITALVDLGAEVDEVVFVTGSYEPNEMAFVASMLQPGMTALDVGANVGWFTLTMASRVGPQGTVVAFEPSPRERARLDEEVDRNRLSWVKVRSEALYDTSATLQLHLADLAHCGHNTLGGFIYQGVEEVQSVAVVAERLDALLPSLALTRLDLVKIDVEGSELRVLKGAAATLRRYRPAILMEVQPASLHQLGDDLAALEAFLAELGYSVCSFDPETGLPSVDRSLPLTANVVALSREAEDRLLRSGVMTSPVAPRPDPGAGFFPAAP
jgi:FkbM family methyltransferase